MTKRILPFAGLLIWCTALLALRIERSNSPAYAFLVWNLFLAAIPFGAALVLEALVEDRQSCLSPQPRTGRIACPPLQWFCLVARRYGVLRGWLVALSALMLSAFGVYLGRFLRFNSWDVIRDPLPVFAEIAARLMDPFGHPTTFAVTALFGVALALGYVAVHAVGEMVGEDARGVIPRRGDGAESPSDQRLRAP